MIQAITRNPLADPGILGVNAGAYLAVAVGAAFFGVTATAQQVWWAIVGAMRRRRRRVPRRVGGARRAPTPATLVLSGVALGRC